MMQLSGQCSTSHVYFYSYFKCILGALLITAVFNLCAVTYERLTAIVLPTETRLTIFGTKIVMACTWVGGFTLAVPLAVYRTYRVGDIT